MFINCLLGVNFAVVVRVVICLSVYLSVYLPIYVSCMHSGESGLDTHTKSTKVITSGDGYTSIWYNYFIECVFYPYN